MRKSKNFSVKLLSLFLGILIMMSFVGISALNVNGKTSSYSIVFNSNSGKGKMNKQIVVYNKSVRINSCKFTKTGYTFLGWSKSKKGKVVYKNKQRIKNIGKAGSKLTLYAQWKKDGKRRAVLLGETSSSAVPINDVKSMNSVMKNSKFHGLKMNNIVYYPNQKKSKIVTKIKSVFKNNNSNDVSYIYI